MVVITTAQLHSKNPEFGFCTGSNPACSKSEIQDGRNLCQWSRLEIWLDTFRWLTIPQKQFIITRNIRKHFFPENHKKSFQAIFFNSFFFFFFFFCGSYARSIFLCFVWRVNAYWKGERERERREWEWVRCYTVFMVHSMFLLVF